MTTIDAVEVVGGCAEGEMLWADVGVSFSSNQKNKSLIMFCKVSFWGGVYEIDGTVIDHTHPLHGKNIAGKVLAIPNGRGSCTGSQVCLELILNGVAPAAFVLRQPDVILALGVIVAEELFGLSVPIVSVGDEGFAQISQAKYAAVEGSTVHFGHSKEAVEAGRPSSPRTFSSPDDLLNASTLALTEEEKSMMTGEAGGYSKAMGMAMRTIARAAAIDGAPSLLPITQAHIDGCTYIGPGGLRFAETLVELGGQVAVPTTLNSISVDRRRWKEIGVAADLGAPAHAVGDAYLALGATHSFTW
jgi:predicted aconitase with swiveling domain